jgi:putative ABC transport system substrate-binding protein
MNAQPELGRRKLNESEVVRRQFVVARCDPAALILPKFVVVRGGDMKRREFIGWLGGAMAWPMSAAAQTVKRIGVLMSNYSPNDREGIASAKAFDDTLKELGWRDGSNLLIVTQWDSGDPARTKASAAELVNEKPDLIVAAANPAVAALRRLTDTIPIVFTRVVNPIGSGFGASLARPGGNITGFQASEPSLGSKWVEVLRELDPAISRIAVVYGSDSGGNVAFLQAAKAGAKSATVALTEVDVHKDTAIEAPLSSFAKEPNGAMIIVPHPWTNSNRKAIIALAERYKLPAVYGYRFFAADGGLMSYGPDQIDQWRGAARYADRILKGEKPGDLPIQAPTKYELVVNQKTADAIGLHIRAQFSIRADEVIE